MKFWVAILLSAVFYAQSCSASQVKAQKETKANTVEEEYVEISFNFLRGGIASSQYAIWIEDKNGKLIRTIYATPFTVKGGYAYRKEAIPTWVSKAKPKEMSAAQIDAVTGATPHNRTLNYIWDGTDDKHRQVADGIYTIYIEGILYWNSRVTCLGKVDWGNQKQSSIPVTTYYHDSSPKNKNMITEVKMTYVVAK